MDKIFDTLESLIRKIFEIIENVFKLFQGTEEDTEATEETV